MKDLNFTLITAIHTVHNADKLDASGGQAQNDSGYDHPRVDIEPSVERVIAVDARRKQRDKSSDYRFGCHRKTPGSKTRDAMFPPHIFLFPLD